MTVWPSVRVADVCELTVDCVNRTAPVASVRTPYKMIRTTNIRNGWIDLEDVRYVDKPTYERWTRRGAPRRNDVILTREAPLGEVGLLRTDEPVFLGQRLYQYRADPTKVDPHFLLYSMLGEYVQHQIRASGSGSTVEHMRLSDCEDLRVALPPLAVQRKVAEILSAYDDLFENNLRRVKLLEEMAQRVYREWLVDFRYPGHECARMGDSESGPIPDGWALRPLFEVADVTFGYPFKSELFNTKGLGRQLIRIRDIPANCSETYTTQACDASYEVVDGDCLIGMDGDFHMKLWAGGGGLLNQRVCRIRPVQHQLGRYGTYLALRQPIQDWNRAIVGTTVAHLGKRHLELIKLLIPERSVRRQLTAVLEPLLDEKIGLERANAVLREARTLLLPRLISGEIDFDRLDIPALGTAG